MVYKIRNKGFGAVFGGTQNVRAYPARKTQVNVDLSSHITLQVQITRFTGMRILHNYRNISRATKQFMMGDRFFEQLMILTLREHYFRPMYYKAPIENTFFLGRTLADLSDRHYALFANNQHPLQLAAYNEYNKFLQDLHDTASAARDEEDGQRFNDAISEAQGQLNAAEGESLSMEDLSDIYIQVKGANRARANMALNTVSKTGEINDYLEVRRPFGAAQ